MHEMSRLPLNSLSKTRAWPSRTSSGRTGAGRTSRVMPRLTASRRTWLARDDRSCPVAGPAADGVVGVSVLQAAADIVPAMPTAYQNFRIETSTGWDRSRPKRPAPAIRRSVPTCEAQVRWTSGHSGFNCEPRPAWAPAAARPSCRVRCSPNASSPGRRNGRVCFNSASRPLMPRYLLQHVVAAAAIRLSLLRLAGARIPPHISPTRVPAEGMWPNQPAPTPGMPAIAGGGPAAFREP
jgi:hypothetical protein